MTQLKAEDLAPRAKDMIVIGAGGAGIAAALTIAEGGAKVVVFEKTLHAGGSIWGNQCFCVQFRTHCRGECTANYSLVRRP